MVCEQEKPNSEDPSMSFLMSVPLPTPDGPHMTSAEGCLATPDVVCPLPWPCPSASEEKVPPILPCCVPLLVLLQGTIFT